MKNIYLFFIWIIPFILEAQQDITPPVLISCQFSSTIINTKYSSQSISFSLTANDDLSGFDQVQILFTSPITQKSVFTWITGINKLEATVTGKLDFEQFSEEGDWSLRIILVDKVGNQLIVSQAMMNALQIPLFITVLSETDKNPPVLKSMSLTSTTINTKYSSQNISFSLTANDDLSGFDQVQILFTSPITQKSVFTWITGINKLEATVTGKLDFEQFSEEGDWSLRIILVDKVGNQLIVSQAMMNALQIPLFITVLSETDKNPPVLKSMSLTSTTINTKYSSQNISFSLTANDDLSGFDQVQILFTSPITQKSVFTWITGINKLEATVTGKLDFEQFSEEGDWSLRIILVDKVGNQLIVSKETMNALQIPLFIKNDYNYLTSIKNIRNIPNDYHLSQNYPNPFNPITNISYRLPTSSYVSLKIFDILGKEIATLVDEDKSAGNYEVKFDATKLSCGNYFYQIKAGSFIDTKKFVLMK